MALNLELLCSITVEDELKKNDRLRKEDLAELRRWVLSKPHFPTNIPDVLLAVFLHSSNYIVEDAKRYVKNSLKVRSESPELFSNRDPLSLHIKTVWEHIDMWVSPKTTTDGMKVLYTGFVDTDPTNYNFAESCKAFIMVGEAEIIKYGTCPGIIVIMDAKGGTYRHLLKAKLNVISKFLFYIQEAIPVNIIQVHVINTFPLIDKVMFIAKPFIKQSLLDSLHFHGSDLTEFYKHVPRDLLPTELGGELSTRKDLHNKSQETLESLRQWFISEESVRINYDKDPTKHEKKQQSKIKVEVTETSFKSLSID